MQFSNQNLNASKFRDCALANAVFDDVNLAGSSSVELYQSARQPFDKRLRNAIVELALSQCDYDLIAIRTIKIHQSLAEVARQQEADFKQQRKLVRSMIQSLVDKDALEGL